MKLSFYGAAHEVTGSCFLLEVDKKPILIDCGMEQGKNIYENQDLPVAIPNIEYILLTHAHIDHSGLIPLMYKRGFRGKVYCTNATANLCNVMLRDSAHIQEFEAEWTNRKGQRAGELPVLPLYTMEDAVSCLELFVPCNYNTPINVFDGLSIRFVDAGHLLGSSSIEVSATENGIKKVIAFSGDIGNMNKPILRDPQYLQNADYVVMEGTYAGRFHENAPDYVADLSSIIQRTFDRGGNVVIPSFAVGRTQEILYFLRIIKEKSLVKGHDGFKVFVDSPLAVEATKIFSQDGTDCYDDETLSLLKNGINPLYFDGLETSITTDDSKSINFDTTSKVIISASGMCEAGRIKHHLKHNLWRKECCVLFVGYQAEGTLGSALINGATSVKLFGETIDVKAEIAQMRSISGHADEKGLIKWISSFSPAPSRVFVVHCDDAVIDDFAKLLTDSYKLNVTAPYNGDGWDILADNQIEFSARKRYEKPIKLKTPPSYIRLLDIQKRLANIISNAKGYSNKDLAKFSDQLNAICDKWE